MKKRIRRLLLSALLIVFLGSSGVIAFTLWQYRVSESLYNGLAKQYTAIADGQASETDSVSETAPLVVDFEALKQVNPDITGWIYCEGTVIDYPVMQGEDNDYYLHHTFDGEYAASGSIFVEASNRSGFADANTIIYGHHMKNKSMFAILSNWSDPAFYQQHPVMWLLTPEQDYKIVLWSGYTVSAYSDTYTIFKESGEEFTQYLQDAAAKSNFQADVELEADSRYVLLSTCAYVFDNARDVLHGKLVPVESAGGVPFTADTVP